MEHLHSDLFVWYPQQKISEYQLRKNASDFDISFESAIRMKLRFVVESAKIWLDVGCEDVFWKCFDNIVVLKNMLKNSERKMKQDITSEDILRAKSVPIESVIDFNKGKAVAFCHPDKNPSLSWDKKNNRAYCFPCSKSFDTIDVLVERDGMSFIEAVKKLR